MPYTEESLRNDIRKKEAQISRITQENSTLTNKLDRIRAAKKRVSNAKKDYNILKDSTRKILDSRNEWKGSQYDKCQESFDNLYSADKNAVSRIDMVLDALERAEGKYERQMRDNNGLISTLQNGINWAWHEIKTLLN